MSLREKKTTGFTINRSKNKTKALEWSIPRILNRAIVFKRYSKASNKDFRTFRSEIFTWSRILQ